MSSSVRLMADGTPIHDVAIIGAGPCGLAVAARLRERSPSALYTDAEHQRFHWINRQSARVSHRTSSVTSSRSLHKQSSNPHQAPAIDVVVYDALSSKWLTGWKRAFAALEISHLRSPLFFHPDPRDRDGMLAFAYEHHRENELVAIRNVVGREISKHLQKKKRNVKGTSCQHHSPLHINERDRNDYYTCTAGLFEAYCQSIIHRYGLEGAVTQAQIHSIDYGLVDDDPIPEKVFTLTSSVGVSYARTVVVAIGPGNRPTIPVPPPDLGSGAACHSSQLAAMQFPTARMVKKMQQCLQTNVLVVGGGLTSAQVTDLAIKRKVTKVWHLMRGSLKGENHNSGAHPLTRVIRRAHRADLNAQ